MSLKKKKLRMRVIDEMLSKQISVGEAKARMDWIKTGVYQPPQSGPSGALALKSAAPASGHERYLTHKDPQVREWAWQASQQAMVTKGLVPGTPAVRQSGTVRALAWAPGPDGTPGWQVPQAAPAGPPFIPPGTAGR